MQFTHTHHHVTYTLSRVLYFIHSCRYAWSGVYRGLSLNVFGDNKTCVVYELDILHVDVCKRHLEHAAVRCNNMNQSRL